MGPIRLLLVFVAGGLCCCWANAVVHAEVRLPNSFYSPIRNTNTNININSNSNSNTNNNNNFNANTNSNNNHNLYNFPNTTLELMLNLRQALLTKSTKFDESFRGLLARSKAEFHRMFLRTYGVLYEQNAEIFTDMYENLERYYATGGFKLDASMNEFFRRLYQKMFQVLNPVFSFSPEYLNCTVKQLDKIKPFGVGVPDKIINEITQSFIATRTLIKALNSGIDVIKNIIALGPSSQCATLVQRISQQQQMAQAQQAKPFCVPYCEQIVNKCYTRLNVEFDREWNQYAEALLQLTNRMRTNWNIEIVVKPIDIRVSEAIMNMQENATRITKQVFQVCGQPNTTASLDVAPNKPFRLRRAIAESSDKRQDMEIVGELVAEISEQINRTVGFWARLPNTVCTSKNSVGSHSPKQLLAPPNCIGFPSTIMSDSQNAGDLQPSGRLNFKLSSADNGYNSGISEQVSTLRTVQFKIHRAINGSEVDWTEAKSVVSSIVTTPAPPDLSSSETTSSNDDESSNGPPKAADDSDAAESSDADNSDQATTGECPPGFERVSVSDDANIEGSGNGSNEGGDDEGDDGGESEDQEDDGSVSEDTESDDSESQSEPNRSHFECRPINDQSTSTSTTASVPSTPSTPSSDADVNIPKYMDTPDTNQMNQGNSVDQTGGGQYPESLGPISSKGTEIGIILDADNAPGSGQPRLQAHSLLTYLTVSVIVSLSLVIQQQPQILRTSVPSF